MRSRGSSGDAWRVGVLVSQTGVTAVAERTQFNGTMLAIREINEGGGVAGRALEPITYDPASRPERFRELADRLLGRDQVNVLFGCYMSSERKAVLPVIERRNALLFYPTMYEGFEYSRSVFYGGAAPNQNSVPLAHYLLKTYGDRLYLVGSDYIFPRESNRIFSELVRQKRGVILGERYFPLTAGENDFNEVIEDIERQKPDAIFSTVVGASTAYFYRAYASAGFDPAVMPIASVNTSEAELQEMGPAVAQGHIVAAPYFDMIESKTNADFVARYRAAFGADAPVTSCSEAAYFQVHMLAKAIERTRSIDSDVLRQALLGMEFLAPQGIVRIDADNNHTYLWSRIGRVGVDGRIEIVHEAGAAVKPDPYMVSPQLNGWDVQDLLSTA